MPQPWDRIVDMLPLKYLAYFPAAVFLGKVPRDELMRGLWIEAAWIVVLHRRCRASHVPPRRAALQRLWRVDVDARNTLPTAASS